jgi:hypothetical protein
VFPCCPEIFLPPLTFPAIFVLLLSDIFLPPSSFTTIVFGLVVDIFLPANHLLLEHKPLPPII